MIPTAFEYQRVNSIAEAIELLSANSGDAKLLAGGHSLIPAMKLRLSTPAKLIDISRIEELRSIGTDGGDLVIGAGCTHGQIASDKGIPEGLALIREAAARIGDVQVRNHGTLGGSLAHADPAADWPAVLLATDAVLVVQGPGGERNINASDFFTGFYETALQANELLTQVRFPADPPGTGKLRSTYLKFEQPASRFALVGCAVAMRIDRGPSCTHVRIAFNGVSDKPFRDTFVEKALQNQLLDNKAIEAAAHVAANGQSVLSDHFASEEYRKHLAKVFARRAISAVADV